MSAFLGPIHYWLYHKIQLQQEITDDIFELGGKYGIALEEECNRLYGVFENKPLEEIIDHGNIHGWLQERVSQAEYKYAYSVTALLHRVPEAYASIKNIAANNGTELAIFFKELPFDASRLYKTIEDSLLDGMPCDHVNRVIKEGDREVLWTRSQCVHSRYWDEVGGDIKIYYELRDLWIQALVRELGFLFDKPDENTYRIRAYDAN